VTGFVLDVTLAWFIDRPISPYAEHVRQLLLRGVRGFVPALWELEIANGFIVAERRGLLTPSDTADALQNIDIIVANGVQSGHPVPMRATLATARTFRLTAYDAVYLETARRQALPLATLDRQLSTAASKAGVELVS
jgi:predicted nucleic acid-binding protein